MVSICIPTYNNVQSLERLLKSIENQTYRDFEVIICDDSIDDRIKETVKKYCQLPIQYHKNKVALGPTKNTNETIKLAKGSYIKVMHHDDCFGSAKSLETMVKALDENENADLFFCGTRETVYERDGKVNKEKTYERCISALEESQLKEDFRNLFLVNMIGAPSATLIRNKGILMDENLKWLVDVDYYFRILEHNSNTISSSLPYIHIGISETQVTRICLADRKLILDETKYVFKKYQLRENKIYRKYLIRMAIDMNFSYEDIRDCDIKRNEYMNHKIRITLRRIVKREK